jgi:hypothetical protein
MESIVVTRELLRALLSYHDRLGLANPTNDAEPMRGIAGLIEVRYASIRLCGSRRMAGGSPSRWCSR